MADIWLRASLIAHDFIPAAFWAGNYEAMRDTYLPASENYALCRDGNMQGFISLSAGGHIEALFVLPESQGCGVGRVLLEHAKCLYPSLSLAVYKDNRRAVDFYSRNGFEVSEHGTDPATGCAELRMIYGA